MGVGLQSESCHCLPPPTPPRNRRTRVPRSRWKGSGRPLAPLEKRGSRLLAEPPRPRREGDTPLEGVGSAG